VQYYKTLENYFSVLLFNQFKGANLVVEALNFQGQSKGSGDSPATQYLKDTFRPMIKEETDMFLNCVVKLIIYNSGLFSENAFLPGAAEAILARATFFIAQTLSEDHYGLRAGILGTANLFPNISHGVALDTHFHPYNAGVGERVDIDLKREDANLPSKAYDFWTSDLQTLNKGTLYALKKYDFVPSGGSGIFNTGSYVVGDDSINTTCTATVKRYTKDYIEDPNGEIVYGYCVAPARIGGTEVITWADPVRFHKNQFTVNKEGRVNYGEEDHLDFPGVLFLKTWGNDTETRTNINAKLEYSRDFTFAGNQDTTAYLNMDLTVNGSVYIHHGEYWSHCDIGFNIGIWDPTQMKAVQVFSRSKSPTDINVTQTWNEDFKQQISFQLTPGKSYYVFANVVGSGDNYDGSYNYEVDITLKNLSLTFVGKDK